MYWISGSLMVLCGILCIAVGASVANTTHNWILPVGTMISGSLFVTGGFALCIVWISKEIDKRIEDNKRSS